MKDIDIILISYDSIIVWGGIVIAARYEVPHGSRQRARSGGVPVALKKNT